jgi:L-cysteine S-thiosulfotransferase
MGLASVMKVSEKQPSRPSKFLPALGLCMAFTAFSLGSAGEAISAALAFDVVDEVSVPQPLVATPADVARGRAVVADRKLGNCLACHQISALSDLPFQGDIAPTLDGVADRYEEGEVRLLVINPKVVFPDTLMPAFYRVDGLHRVAPAFQGKPILTAQQVEDVVAFLMTLHDVE